MRVASDLYPLLTALKIMHRDLQAMSSEIEELRKEVKESGGGIRFVIQPESDETDETDSDTSSDRESVQSAPASLNSGRTASDVALPAAQ